MRSACVKRRSSRRNTCCRRRCWPRSSRGFLAAQASVEVMSAHIPTEISSSPFSPPRRRSSQRPREHYPLHRALNLKCLPPARDPAPAVPSPPRLRRGPDDLGSRVSRRSATRHTVARTLSCTRPRPHGEGSGEAREGTPYTPVM